MLLAIGTMLSVGAQAEAQSGVRHGAASVSSTKSPLRHVDVTFDPTTGTIRVVGKFKTPVSGDSESVGLRRACGKTFGETAVDPDVWAVVAPRSGAESSVEDPQFDETSTWDPDTATTTLVATWPKIVGADLRCAEIDEQIFWFDGYGPITPAAATSLVRADLVRRGGKAFRRATIACPAQPAGVAEPRILTCRTILRRGSRATVATYRVDSRRPSAPALARTSHRTYRTTTHRCAIDGRGLSSQRRYDSTWSVGGRFSCRADAVFATMDKAIDAFPKALPRTFTISTDDRAGDADAEPKVTFPAFDTMHCRASTTRAGKSRVYAVRCANRVGDRFNVRSTVRRATANDGEDVG